MDLYAPHGSKSGVQRCACHCCGSSQAAPNAGQACTGNGIGSAAHRYGTSRIHAFTGAWLAHAYKCQQTTHQNSPHDDVVPPAAAVPVGQAGADVVVHLHQPAAEPHAGHLHSKPTVAARLAAGWALRQARTWHGHGPGATCSHVDRAGDAPSCRPAMEVREVCRPCKVLDEWGVEECGGEQEGGVDGLEEGLGCAPCTPHVVVSVDATAGSRMYTHSNWLQVGAAQRRQGSPRCGAAVPGVSL